MMADNSTGQEHTDKITYEMILKAMQLLDTKPTAPALIYSCGVCGRWFATDVDLMYHSQTHGQRSY